MWVPQFREEMHRIGGICVRATSQTETDTRIFTHSLVGTCIVKLDKIILFSSCENWRFCIHTLGKAVTNLSIKVFKSNLKFLLFFEEISTLKINFDKREVVKPLGNQKRIMDNLNYRIASFLITYLGVLIRDTRILIKDLDPVVGWVRMKAKQRSARSTSKVSKTILIDYNLPMYSKGHIPSSGRSAWHLR
jgi:hypothetical protein